MYGAVWGLYEKWGKGNLLVEQKGFIYESYIEKSWFPSLVMLIVYAFHVMIKGN